MAGKQAQGPRNFALTFTCLPSWTWLEFIHNSSHVKAQTIGTNASILVASESIVSRNAKRTKLNVSETALKDLPPTLTVFPVITQLCQNRRDGISQVFLLQLSRLKMDILWQRLSMNTHCRLRPEAVRNGASDTYSHTATSERGYIFLSSAPKSSSDKVGYSTPVANNR